MAVFQRIRVRCLPGPLFRGSDRAARQGDRPRARRPGPADLARRGGRTRVLGVDAFLAVRRLPAAVGGQFPDAVPGTRADVAARVCARARRLSSAAKRRRRAQVPGAWRHRDGDAADGCVVALRRQRLARAFHVRGRVGVVRRHGQRGCRAGRGRVLPQGCHRPVSRVGARRLRGGAGAGDLVHGDDHQGGRAAGRRAPVRYRADCAANGGRPCDPAVAVDRVGQSRRDAPAELPPDDRLLVDRARGLPVLRLPGRTATAASRRWPSTWSRTGS